MSELLPNEIRDSTNRIELEEGWEFLPDASGRLRYADLPSQTGWRPARVGLSWNAQFEDLRDFMGAAWYRTSLDIPSFRETRHVVLRFGAVDYFCELFVNGIPIGDHEGGYTPFSFDITGAVHPGVNEIALRVVDPPMNEGENRELFPDMMYHEIPHGKQNWYVQNSGIWQGVRAEFSPSVYIERVAVTPQRDGRFTAHLRFAGVGVTADGGSVAQQTRVRAIMYDSSGRNVFQFSDELGPRNVIELEGVVKSPRLWSPDDPHLYVLEVALSGAVKHRRRVRFGFRSFEAKDGRFYLNGKPFYMVGALDQDFYPETIHTPASAEFVRRTMLQAKRLGVNLLRCHLKVAHPVYLDVADEIGMLVWAEMPSWSDCWFPCDHFSMRAAVRGERMFDEVIARDWNHPSIVVHTIMNESWGIDLKQEDQRRWLRDAYERVKKTVEPLGRLVVDNSACEGNFHLKTDIEDFHQYYSMPDQVGLWDKWLDELSSRPAWTFSPHGDSDRGGYEPLLVSEFGNWGLPSLPENEELPWWYHYSFGGREVTNPSGVFDRFNGYQLATEFAGYNDFAAETQWHQYISLKYEIESIRAHASVQGYVVTGITDVHWEVNGLLDMWRRNKVFSEDIARIQRPDIVFGRPRRWTYFAGEEIEAELLISHYSSIDLSGARVRWSTDSGSSGSVPVGAIAAGEVQALGSIRWRSPEGDAPTVDRVYLELRGRAGARLAENTIDVFVLPRIRQAVGVSWHDPNRAATPLRDALGERIVANSTVLLATSLDHDVLAHVQDGNAAVVMIDSEDALPEQSNIVAKPRAGNELDGRWFSNFNWVRSNRPPYRNLTFSRILGFESTKVVPRYVLQGIPREHFDDVLAGATFGWIQLNSAMAVQVRLGKGRLLLTTFRFDNYEQDPYSAALLEQFIQYVTSDECQPRLELVFSAQEQRA